MKSARKFIAAGLFAAGLVSQAHAVPFYGLAQGQGTSLLTFDSSAPAIFSSVAVTGFTGTLLSIDVRPLTGQLYALSSTSNLYTINTVTGAATLVGALSTPLNGSNASIDFNPTVDRIRIVTDLDQNLRVNPANGVALVDLPLAFAAGDVNAGDNPNVSAVAYTNSFAGSTTTTLYDFELGNNVLTTQAPPNDGTLNTVGALGAAGLQGFDIFFFGNQAFGSTFTDFYRINLGTGAATLVGAFGPNVRVTDIAAAQVPEPATGALIGLGLLGFALSTRRKRA